MYEEIKAKSRDAVLGLIQKEREGELIERTLIKNILGIFIEVGGGWGGWGRDGIEYFPAWGGLSGEGSHVS